VSHQSASSTPTPTSPIHSWFAPHRIVLTTMWLVITVVIVTMLWHDVRDTDRYGVARYMQNGGYVAALLWYLSRLGPTISPLLEQ
jgi:hypothetical protein